MELTSYLEKYKGKKVLVTGHTGFKGSWLAIWLHELGASVIGYALNPIHDKDNFVLSNISNKITDIRGDIRDREKLFKVFDAEKPEIVFHLAAQALVLDGYEDPVSTYDINFTGTLNVLEAIRKSSSVHTAIFITTDKVYENKERIWPYREDEALGGYDPYSSSKGASELLIASYRNSFFNVKDYVKHKKAIASVRAGNVIGGGDWSANRILPDCIKAIENNETISVRNPYAIRPWQHVLDPLAGYLLLGAKMQEEPIKYCESWNFGPEANNHVNVKTLVSKVIEKYQLGSWKDISNKNTLHEATFLALDINKAKYKLNWKPKLDLDRSIQFTVEWYKNYQNSSNVLGLCLKQIDIFSKIG